MTINDVKLLCKQKEQQLIKDKNNSQVEKDLLKVKMIQDILKLDNCFLNVSPNEALNILYFLGIEKDKLKESYLSLISDKNYVEKESLKLID